LRSSKLSEIYIRRTDQPDTSSIYGIMFVAKLQWDRFGFCNRKYLNESGVKKLEMVGIIFEVSGGF
jgi:hypothetical protein